MGEDAQIKRYEMTQEGYDELEAELDQLSNVKMKEIAKKLAEAREQGDLSENAEYDAAKNEQSEINGRIEKIKHMLQYAVVVPQEANEKGRIGMGSIVTHDVPQYEIWAGNPARKIRDRFDKDVAAQLAAIPWEEWDDATLRQRANAFNDVDAFIKEFRIQ